MKHLVRAHKVGSVVYRLGLTKDLEVTKDLDARPGNAIVVRALNEKRVYSELELDNGRMSKIFRGDVIVGALGRRRALRGFSGEVPGTVRVGDTLAVLNRGGVIGTRATPHKDLGQPVACEVLGMPLRDGRVANIADACLPVVASLEGAALPPICVVSGTAMESGKTLLISELIQELSKAGFSIAGGKLTGVACLRDLISMEDHGAVKTASFLDTGHASTAGLSEEQLRQSAYSVVAYLSATKPDLIVLELGDGILGDYGVLSLLLDRGLASQVRMHVFCASDLVGAWGGARVLQERGISIDVFSGPATDNQVGVNYLENELGRPAINAFTDPEGLAAAVREQLGLEDRTT